MARGKGEGTIHKLDNGTYQARMTVGYDENGKQKRQAKYFKTIKEAKEWITEVKAARDKGNYIEPSKITVGEWLDIWLEEYKKRSVRKSTYSSHCYSINIHIKPVFGKIKLKDLRTEMIQKFINNLNDKGLAQNTILVIYSTLYGALEQAVVNELVLKNIATKIRFPEVPKKEIKVMTVDEQERFLEVAKNSRYGDLFILMLATGMRLGEAIALTWHDINFENGMLSINKTLSGYYDYELGGVCQKEIGPPKTKSSNRTIPLLPNVLEMLKNKKQKNKPNEKNLLFPNPRGELIAQETARFRLRKLLKEANIDESVHPHTLRHTFATRGLENGIELKVMQELLGHSSIKMTADTYSHVLPDKKIDSVMKLKDTIIL